MLGVCSTFRMNSGTGVWTLCASSVAGWFVVDVSAFRRSGLVGCPDDHRDNGDGTPFVAWSVGTLWRGGCVMLDALDATTTANTWPASVSTCSA